MEMNGVRTPKYLTEVPTDLGTVNPTTERGTSAYLQRKPLPNLPIQKSLLSPNNNVAKYAKWMERNPAFMKTYSDSPKQSLMEAGKLRDEAEKTLGLGKHEAEWDSVTDGKKKGTPK